MPHFKSKGPGYSVESAKGKISVWVGATDDGEKSFVLRIQSKDGEVKHDILLSSLAAYAIATLIPVADMAPIQPLNIEGEDLLEL